MTHTTQPHVPTLPAVRGHRITLVAVLAVLICGAGAITIAVTRDGSPGRSSTPSTSIGTGFAGGPAAGTPSAVSQAFNPSVRGTGLSLTTNVPPPPRYESSPASGTPAAVSSALATPTPSTEAGPTFGTPAAVRAATSAR